MQEYNFPNGMLHINDVLVDIETQRIRWALFLFCAFSIFSNISMHGYSIFHF